MKHAVATLAIDARTAGADATYTYRAVPETRVGQAYLAPLGTRSVLGFVVHVGEVEEAELGFDVARLRPVGERVPDLDLAPAMVSVTEFVAAEYLCPLSVALSGVVPPGVRNELVTTWKRTAKPVGEIPLSPAQQELLRVVEEHPAGLTDARPKGLTEPLRRAMRLLANKGLVLRDLSLRARAERHRISGMLQLTDDQDAIETFLVGQGRSRPAQALAVMRLQGSAGAALSAAEIKVVAGVTDTTLTSLVAAGLLHTVDEKEPEPAKPPTLNPAQAEAFAAIEAAVARRRFESFLLYGVTGSGKTEVYLRSAAAALEAGRQVLYLVPEIALTAQVVAQLRARFGSAVAVLHSAVSPRDRLLAWSRVRSGDAPVVLGARSAVFAPLNNVGLIVLDEEHEGSYKQDSAPRYHARRVAQHLAEWHGCPLVLGSATPGAESFQAAHDGRALLLRLPHRAAEARLPAVFVEDLALGYRERRPVIFTERLIAALREALEQRHQTILFLNRRAYAPFLLCRECGHSFKCPNCSVTLAFHRRDAKLRCHQCDHTEPPPETCPQCGSSRVQPVGVGVERVEEAVRQEFPEARVARLDRDVVRRSGELERILAAFRGGDTDVLVGTQMVAKGLDFPNVTVVGVVTADVTLNLPDFRASERAFQLLSQVAGRAGRGSAPGQVILQTFNPDHPAVRRAAEHDTDGFLARLLEERRESEYPPFSRLVNVTVASADRRAVLALTHEVAERARTVPDAIVLGPADCAIERLKNQWRRHVVVKLPADAPVAPLGQALAGIDAKGASLVVDVDPSSLL